MAETVTSVSGGHIASLYVIIQKFLHQNKFIEIAALLLLRHKLQKPSNDAAFERLKHWLFLPEITACAGSPFSF